MKIILRQMGRECFFVGYDQTVRWSEDQQQAVTFPTYRAATAVCAHLNLKEVEILIKYQNADILVMPLTPCEEFVFITRE